MLDLLDAWERHGPAEAELGRWVALRHLWWLALHARAWGRFPLHRHQPQFFDAGIELLEAICEDACGARLGALSGRSARGGS